MELPSQRSRHERRLVCGRRLTKVWWEVVDWICVKMGNMFFTPPSYQLRSEFAKAKSQAKWSDSKSLLCMSDYSEFDRSVQLVATVGQRRGALLEIFGV